MLSKLRQRSQSESGFTLVELLVVMLILGILAAIAIPAFFNQRDKAQDADAKVTARTAETAMETYATDHGGEYTGADAAALHAIEATLPATAPDLVVDVVGDENGVLYTVTALSDTDNTFSITRNGDGTKELTCETENEAGCPDGGIWSGDPS
jgi:type IV pilus assembly protein PilA